MDEAPFANNAVDKAAVILTNQEYVDANLIGTDFSTFGIDYSSIEVLSWNNTTAPRPRWNAQTLKLRIYRPTDGAAQMALTYRWKDVLGNSSNIANVYVNTTILVTAWRGYAPSMFCQLNQYNMNTGYRSYSDLERYYPALNVPYLPQQLKPNVSTDPDYIAPVFDLTTCNQPGTVPFAIVNNLNAIAGSPVITKITFRKLPAADLVFTTNVFAGTGVTLLVPPAIYDFVKFDFLPQGAYPVKNWQYERIGVGTQTGQFLNSQSIQINNAQHSSPGTEFRLSN